MTAVKTITCGLILFSASCAFAARDVSPTRRVLSLPPTCSSRSEICFCRAFVGGQDVVHVTKAGVRRAPFMDVKASELLISYEFDAKGRLVDRVVWFDNQSKAARPAGS